PEGGNEPARERGLAYPQRPAQRNHVAPSREPGQLAAKAGGRRFIAEDHFDPRGMTSVTVVPFPFFDSSSTVPPCASMNWRVSGSPRPSAASPLTPASTTRSKRLNTRGKSLAEIPDPLSL